MFTLFIAPNRLFGYVEGEETKRRLRASRSALTNGAISPTAQRTSTPSPSKEIYDDELIKIQNSAMNSDLYKLIIAENEKREQISKAATFVSPEIDYTEIDEEFEAKDELPPVKGIYQPRILHYYFSPLTCDVLCIVAEEEEEDDYMKLIASLNLDVAPRAQKEVWEVKYNTVVFNVLVGGSSGVKNDGIMAAAKLIKKAKQAMLEQEKEKKASGLSGGVNISASSSDPNRTASPKRRLVLARVSIDMY